MRSHWRAQLYIQPRLQRRMGNGKRGLQKVLRNAEMYLLHSARGRRNEFWSLNKWKEARPLGINVPESNMARDTCPFLAGFPTKSSLYSGFSIAMFDNPRVHTFLYQM